jgi:hypothetical protein
MRCTRGETSKRNNKRHPHIPAIVQRAQCLYVYSFRRTAIRSPLYRSLSRTVQLSAALSRPQITSFSRSNIIAISSGSYRLCWSFLCRRCCCRCRSFSVAANSIILAVLSSQYIKSDDRSLTADIEPAMIHVRQTRLHFNDYSSDCKKNETTCAFRIPVERNHSQ